MIKPFASVLTKEKSGLYLALPLFTGGRQLFRAGAVLFHLFVIVGGREHVFFLFCTCAVRKCDMTCTWRDAGH